MVIFKQRFQVCVLIKEIKEFKLWAYEVDWMRPNQVTDFIDKKYIIEINQIGQKEFIQKTSQFQKSIKIENYFMVPLLDDNLTINGTQLYINYENSIKKIFSL